MGDVAQSLSKTINVLKGLFMDYQSKRRHDDIILVVDY